MRISNVSYLSEALDSFRNQDTQLLASLATGKISPTSKIRRRRHEEGVQLLIVEPIC